MAMREAGLVKQHKAICWSNGSSLPKTTRIDTQADRNNGRMFEDRYPLARHIRAQREKLGISRKEVNDWFGYSDGCSHWERTDPEGARVPSLADWPLLKERLQLDDLWTPFIERIEAEREVVGTRHDGGKRNIPILGTEPKDYDITAPATPLAQTWAGHRYGAQALRNLVESILIFRKPYEGKAYESIVRTGAGSLNIEGSRIGHNEPEGKPTLGMAGKRGGIMGETVMRHRETASADTSGRHPSNFYLTHHEKCIPRGTKRIQAHWSQPTRGDQSNSMYSMGNESQHKPIGYADADGTEEVAAWDCARDESGAYLCPVALLDEQAGETANMHGAGRAREAIRKCKPSGNLWKLAGDGQRYGDTGGPSRFSFNADWQHEAFERTARRIPDDTGHAIEDANAVRYQSKPSRTERDAGLDGGRGKSSIFGSIKVRECNVCGTRANGAGRGGTWPECGHEDWKYIEKKSEELEQLKGDSGVRAGNSHPT